MRQSGFTLLEVLVAILVLSIGLLGLAGLMASSIRNNHSAYQRTQATWLAYDMIDRMRVNRANAISSANNYNIAIGTATSGSSGLAGADVTGWKTTLANALPAGDGSVAVDSTSRAVTVIVQWNDSRGTGGNSAQQLRVDTQL
ncbi:MAG TPA: type IV pilus modification protein PilV [Thiobacillus sp.]|nr:MAG: type IV pilus modification protein PilV [Hydrogenophilales bacterium 28-61-11]OYZ59126.1 MAG: type IV pilus modification protein PilV [Hydrogenophilales bacterium 16-61-112]OZA46454.1 MAG: type IV pilus modification protein PilV [Hydrogenophilales bacterium 17-61-76]HQT31470.1 type IV pilus modification protein PilV [Thiobacillus sp.]HQT70616.1 type IV pilus modification protein PilV [Thiobacillus sp.]